MVLDDRQQLPVILGREGKVWPGVDFEEAKNIQIQLGVVYVIPDDLRNELVLGVPQAAVHHRLVVILDEFMKILKRLDCVHCHGSGSGIGAAV
jgi:hypothetical protein